MSRNLPPGVSINDKDAPWNQTHPEPVGRCPHCDEWLLDYDTRIVRTVMHKVCPECGNVIAARQMHDRYIHD